MTLLQIYSVQHCVKGVLIRSYSGPYLVQMRENTDQSNSEYEHFSRSAVSLVLFRIRKNSALFYVKVYLLTSPKVSKYGIVSGPYFLVFGLNTGKYGPEISPYLDTFHAVTHLLNLFSVENLSKKFSRIKGKKNRSFNY